MGNMAAKGPGWPGQNVSTPQLMPPSHLTLYTVPNAPEPSTLIFLNSVSFKILKRAWLGASPLGVRGSTSCETQEEPGSSQRRRGGPHAATGPLQNQEEWTAAPNTFIKDTVGQGLPDTGVLEQQHWAKTCSVYFCLQASQVD